MKDNISMTDVCNVETAKVSEVAEVGAVAIEDFYSIEIVSKEDDKEG